MTKHHVAALAAAVALAIPSASRADLLVDDFEDSASNLTSNWETTPWGQNSSTFPFPMVVGAGFAARSTSTSTAAFSPKWAFVRTVAGWPDAVYGYGSASAPPAALVTVPPYNWPTSPVSYTTWGTAITASNRTPDAEKYQSVALSMGNGLSTSLNMNSTGPDAQDVNYIRVTAWRDAAVTPPAGSFFAVTLIANGPSFGVPGNMSTGPWDPTGTTLVGLPLSTTPQTFLLDVRNTTLFKIDPVYATLNAGTTTLTPANFGDLVLLQFGYRRNGADAGLGTLDARFYIDDVMILKAKPAFLFSSNVVSVPEGGSNTLTVSLAAMPARNVVLDLTSLTPAEIQVTPATLTFTGGNSGNWATPQTITFTSLIDDSLDEPPQDFTVTKNRDSSVDQWYKDSTDADLVASLGDITVTVIDNDPAPGAFFASSAALPLSEADGPVSIEVQLPSPAAEPLIVTIGATGTAVDGVDYTLSTTTLTFVPGDTSASFAIDPTDDLLDEDDEGGTLEIVAQSSGTPGSPATRTFTIADNDDPPSASWGAAWVPTTLTEPAGSADLSIELSAPSGKTITIPVLLNPSATATDVFDFSFSATSFTLNPGDTTALLTVTIADDSEVEGPETVIVDFGTLVNATTTAGPSPILTLNSEDVSSVRDWTVID